MVTARVRRGVLSSVLALVVGVVALAPASAQDEASSPDDAELTIMARNLYLGADVGVALDLLPDLSAAAQFMWDQVAETDFDARVATLAAEAARYRPDVIGLQEATVWSCRTGLFGSTTPVFDFTEQFLEAAADAGVGYVVAQADGERAENPGYSIPAIPSLTTVVDPETFQPIFGRDSADCGFTIGDVVLVREDLAQDVLAVGRSEFEQRYAVVPVVFTIDRGYSWVDLAIGGTTVRVVTTHLESLWDAGSPVPSAEQARQLVDDLATTTVPLVVMGDFNADPRDPRPPEDPNPAGQPEASEVCPAQVADPDAQTADASCNAYWTMVAAGYQDAGPDALDPTYFTWGSAADLAGPEPERLDDALAQGNVAGFTERLDHVFVANGAAAIDAVIIGNEWPTGPDLWECSSPGQVETTEAASRILAEAGVVAEPVVGQGLCLPTDHAGVVATIDVSAGPPGAAVDPAPPTHDSVRIGLLGWIGIILGVALVVVVLLLWGVVALVRRRRSRTR